MGRVNRLLSEPSPSPGARKTESVKDAGPVAKYLLMADFIRMIKIFKLIVATESYLPYLQEKPCVSQK